MNPGSIVRIFVGATGYDKYHLCLCLPSSDSAAKFLYINSDPKFKDLYVVDDQRIPCLPASPTGKSCFSFTMIPRYSQQQLSIFRATTLGHIDLALLKSFGATLMG